MILPWAWLALASLATATAQDEEADPELGRWRPGLIVTWSQDAMQVRQWSYSPALRLVAGESPHPLLNGEAWTKQILEGEAAFAKRVAEERARLAR